MEDISTYLPIGPAILKIACIFIIKSGQAWITHISVFTICITLPSLSPARWWPVKISQQVKKAKVVDQAIYIAENA